MELLEKLKELKEYIKVLEKAHDEYDEKYWQACINDLNRMIDEEEDK